MRAQARQRVTEDEEEESSFVSMTDMTVSFLFIVMILLAFFASQLHDKGTVSKVDYDNAVAEWKKYEKLSEDRQKLIDALRALIAQLELKLDDKDQKIAQLLSEIEKLKQDPLKDYLRDVAQQRGALLKQLQKQLNADFPELQVIVSAEMDALRFKGDGLFPFSSSELAPPKRKIVEALADRLQKILPCYTLGPQSLWDESCNPVGAVIEAVQIEGHTDSDGPDNTNLTLSTERANATFFAMTARQVGLTGFRNTLDQPVLSVAGYGKMRPVTENTTPEGKATNRRIDLRVIMYTPRSLEDIERVKAVLRRNVQGSTDP